MNELDALIYGTITDFEPFLEGSLGKKSPDVLLLPVQWLIERQKYKEQFWANEIDDFHKDSTRDRFDRVEKLIKDLLEVTREYTKALPPETLLSECHRELIYALFRAAGAIVTGWKTADIRNQALSYFTKLYQHRLGYIQARMKTLQDSTTIER